MAEGVGWWTPYKAWRRLAAAHPSRAWCAPAPWRERLCKRGHDPSARGALRRCWGGLGSRGRGPDGIDNGQRRRDAVAPNRQQGTRSHSRERRPEGRVRDHTCLLQDSRQHLREHVAATQGIQTSWSVPTRVCDANSLVLGAGATEHARGVRDNDVGGGSPLERRISGSEAPTARCSGA